MEAKINIGDILLCRKTYIKRILNRNIDVPVLTFGKKYEIIDFYAWGGVSGEHFTIVDDSEQRSSFTKKQIEEYFVVGKRMRKLKIRILNKK